MDVDEGVSPFPSTLSHFANRHRTSAFVLPIPALILPQSPPSPLLWAVIPCLDATVLVSNSAATGQLHPLLSLLLGRLTSIVSQI